MKTVLVLGARGGVGSAVAAAYLAAGWRVLAHVRAARIAEVPEGMTPITGALSDPQAIIAQCGIAQSGAVDVVFNGLNAPYHQWRKLALPLFSQALDLAEALGARHIMPGNVYVFGRKMPRDLWPTTPFRPTTVKGKIRAKLEAMIAKRVKAGRLSSLIVRAGDFFGPNAAQSWLNSLVLKDVNKGIVWGVGRPDAVHAFAFLPDLAKTFVALSDIEATLEPQALFHFDGHNVSLNEIAKEVEIIVGKPMRIRSMPQPVFWIMAAFMPFMWGALEMLYLWSVPHALRDDRLDAVIGPRPHTSLYDALRQIIAV
jgi:nucleoside-diphosphate-sugar epimerase